LLLEPADLLFELALLAPDRCQDVHVRVSLLDESISIRESKPWVIAQRDTMMVEHIIHAEMNLSFEETLVEVWRQALVENATVVELDGGRCPVRRTPKRGLRQVDFIFDCNEIRGLEQNPDTGTRWAKLARSGKEVMQFLSAGRYLAIVVDGKVILYGRSSEEND
jgi:hypothetical protein